MTSPTHKTDRLPGEDDTLGLEVGLQTLHDLVQQGVVVLEHLQQPCHTPETLVKTQNKLVHTPGMLVYTPSKFAHTRNTCQDTE